MTFTLESKMLTLQLFLCVTISFTVVSAQGGGSCVGRCGQGYFRADPCHCDYTCMTYMECCPDYKTVCTTEGSCQGRCHEGFIRGQTCDCDASCIGYGKCCPDFEKFCAKPVQRQPTPPPQRQDPDPRDNSPIPTRKPEERVPENTPEEPSLDDKDRKPKNPKVKDGDKPEDSDPIPKDPNPKNPDDKDGKKRKPENPKPEAGEDGPGDPARTPRERLPKSPKDEDDNPQKRKTSKVIESTEEEEEETQTDQNDDSPRKPSPSDKGKRYPSTDKPNKKKKLNPEDYEYDDSPRKPSPSDKGKRIPTTDKPKKKKKVNPEDDEDDEPLKPGKGKNPKKKPSTKDIVKKKKINSEEERQETVEREFSSSSQSSSSHSRSKSVRRKTGKNKKNKKKFPEEEPEEPLMPPNRKKYPPSTPVYPTPDEGSGEDGSGMDFLQTTISSTTVSLNTSTQMLTTVGTKKTAETLKSSINPQTESTGSSYKTTTKIPTPVSTGKQSTDSLMTTVLSTQSSTEAEKTKRPDTTTGTTPQQMSTLKTPQDQSTAGSNVKHTTPGLEKTSVPLKSTSMGPTKHTSHSSESGLTTLGKDDRTSPKDQSMNKMNEYSTTNAPQSTLDPNKSESQTKDTMAVTTLPVTTNPTKKHADDFISPKDEKENPSAMSTTSTTIDQSIKQTTRKPRINKTTKPSRKKPIPDDGLRYQAATTQLPNIKTTSTTQPTTTKPKDKNVFTTMPVNEDNNEITKAPTTPYTIHPHHICNLLKDEAISWRIPEIDLRRLTEICAEMQKQYPNINIPSLPTRQPNIDDRMIPPSYPLPERIPWYQQPGSNILQIIEEINRRMNISPITNLTGIPSQNTHKSTAWLLLINKIKHANDPLKNLCIGPPANGMTTLQNGSLVVFRGHYFWTLNQGGVTTLPRKISEVWGVPSPIDTVFTRCNCGGKTFFFKGPRYWRFTNDVMDKGYPKEIIKGFGGLTGKVTAVLSVAGVKTRAESVYFFKPAGKVQKYTFRQEQTKRCTKKKQPSVNYPIYSQKVQTVKFRFPRDIIQHRIQIRRTYTSIPQPLGILHEERTVRSTWRGIPSNIVSAVSLPSPLKQDGFDYFVFTKDKYYNINMSSKVAMKPPAEAEQKTTKDWYKCTE